MLRQQNILCRDDGGSAIETVFLTPVVVFTLGFLPVQMGLWWHEKQLLTAAAHEASYAASMDHRDLASAKAAGAQAATAFTSNSSLLKKVEAADVQVTNEVVRVRLTAQGTTVIPRITINISAEAVSARERFVSGP